VSPSSTTTYSVSYTLPGCPSAATASATVTVSPPLSATATTPVIACGQTTAQLTINVSGGTAPYSFSMDAGSSFQSSNNFNLVAGSYTIRIKDNAGCSTDIAATVQAAPSPMLITNQPAPVCAPATINLTAAAVTSGSDPGLSFTYWTDANASVALTNPSAIAFSQTCFIKGTDAQGCSAIKPVDVTIETSLPGIRYTTVMAFPNVPVTLQARPLSNTTYQWIPPDGLNNPAVRDPIFNYDKKTLYRITLTSASGCITVDTLLVDLASIEPNVFVPKAWSPNGDGHNDYLFPFLVNITQLKFFIIYNRWGQKVFETNVMGNGWDGQLNRVGQPMDVYTWVVEATGINGEKFRASGQAILLR
jgi:gliding motility-associated-like protein